MSALRLAFRAVRRQRGSSAVIVLTLAVAIAGATIIYSVADLFWHFLPAQRQDE